MQNLIERAKDWLQSVFRKIQRFRNRQRLLLITDSVLEESLRKLDIWEPLQRGEIRCWKCQDVITLDNLQGWVRRSGHNLIFKSFPIRE